MGVFNNLFGKRKEEKREGISCPYCKHAMETEKVARWILITEPTYSKSKEWLHRHHCSNCHQSFWLVGSYDKLLGSKEIRDGFRR